MTLEKYRSALSLQGVMNGSSNKMNAECINQHDQLRQRPQKKVRMRQSFIYLALGGILISASIIYNSSAVLSIHNATDREKQVLHQNPGFVGPSHANDIHALLQPKGGVDRIRNNPRSWIRPKHIISPVDVLFEEPETLRLPKPIINVGFPKAGTSSIFSFFRCNGLKAQHWLCCDPQDNPKSTLRNKLMSRCILENLITKSPILGGCGDYDVYTEINGPRQFRDYDHRTLLEDGRLLTSQDSVTMKLRIFFPQHHHLEEIHEQYPNATLILNKRSVKSWIDSVLAWNNHLQFQILNEFFEQNSTRFLFENAADEKRDGSRKYHPIHGNVKDDDFHPSVNMETPHRFRTTVPFTGSTARTHLETLYHYHMRYVRDFAAKHPSHALVEVDIADENAGATLAHAFGLKEECWGHYNKNSGRHSNARDRSRVQSHRANGGLATHRKRVQHSMAVSGQRVVTKPPLAPVNDTKQYSTSSKRTKEKDVIAAAPKSRPQEYLTKRTKMGTIYNEKFEKLGIEVNITQSLLEARAG